MKNRYVYRLTYGLVCCVLASLTMINQANADGTEQLGMPSILIAQGSQILVEGTGLIVQSGNISVEIPSDVNIAQVLLYWIGRSDDPNDHAVEDTIQVNGMDVTGKLIGGPADLVAIEDGNASITYRADITDMSDDKDWILVGQTKALVVDGLDFDYSNDGAAVVVILDDGTAADIMIMDGNDFAFEPWGNQTVPVEFPVAPSVDAQVGYMSLIVTDVDIPRPAAVDVTVAGVTTRVDLLLNNEGDFLDVVYVEVPVPAGASNVTVQVLSVDDDTNELPASLAWSFVSWELAIPHTECGGGGLTPGFWQNKHGLRLIDEHDALVDLNALCLRNDAGEHADFATLRQFRAWIKSRRAKNMAFQLSGHLAAMYMNVLVGSVNGDAMVYIGHEGDTISINNLLSAANGALCEDGETFSGDENRDYQEMLKNALDKANNNQNWVYPCSH